MPVPLIPIAMAVGGAATGVVGQIGLNKLSGQKTTRKDVAVGAMLGAIPGAAQVKYGSRIAKTLPKLRHVKKSDTVADVSRVMLSINKRNLARLGESVIRANLIYMLADKLFPEHSHSAETQSVPGSRNVRRVTTKSTRNASPLSYCKKHRKMDMCKRFNKS